MSFLKKYYEKIILTALLVVFVGSLVYLISVIASKKIPVEELFPPERNPNYKRVNFNQYNTLKALVQSKQLRARTQIKVKNNNLMTPSEYAKCYHCNKLTFKSDIPKTPSEFGECSICKGKLRGVGEIVVKDKDNDGLPNELEDEIKGLDSNNPSDAKGDLDNDGFHNLMEYEINTFGKYNDLSYPSLKGKINLNDSKSHLPLALRIVFTKVERKKINLRLKKVRVTGKSKAEWEIHMDIREKNKHTRRMRWKTHFSYLGDTIVTNTGKYKIIDVIEKKIEFYDKKIKATQEKDVSQIIIEELKSKTKITVTVKLPVYDTREKITFVDKISNKVYKRSKIDTYLNIGNRRLGKEKYFIKKVNYVTEEQGVKKANSITLISSKFKKSFEIKKTIDIELPVIPEKREFLDEPGSPPITE